MEEENQTCKVREVTFDKDQGLKSFSLLIQERSSRAIEYITHNFKGSCGSYVEQITHLIACIKSCQCNPNVYES